MANIPDISLPSETVVEIAGIGVTNSVLATAVTSVLIIVLIVLSRLNLRLVPNRLQVCFEMVIEYLDEILTAQFNSKKLSRTMLPLMVTLFIFIFIANQFSLIPLLQSIIVEGESVTNLFRVPTSDLSLPFTMAILVMGLTQVIAFIKSPLGHIGNYIRIAPLFKFKNASDLFTKIIEFFLGFLDIISEFAKTVALAVRLFGNVIAGELMILIISGLAGFTSFFVPIPFYILSIFSGVIQTLVFVFLSIGFMSTTINAVEPDAAEA
jgi:F-type H+-transporting ATPase subunit a